MTFRRSLRFVTLTGAAFSALNARGATYYVSNTGSDNNSGTAPGSAWQSLAKIDSTTLAPGSQVLFQDGGNWYGSQLIASSSGTASQPITYGSYGSGAAPTLWGSVPVSTSQLIYTGGTTYFYPSATPVNAFFMDHQFTHNATLLTSTNYIGYVQSHVNSSYYQAGTNPGVFVNTGTTPQYLNSFYTFSAAVTDDVVSSGGQDNLVFQNLNVRESAKSDAGYGIRVQNSSNVTVQSCTVSGAGKHAVGVIDGNNFLGQNITASNLLPDQGNGGATAFVSYADSNVTNTTAQWINNTFTNANGSYQGFITHSDASGSDPSPIASLLVKNLVCTSFPSITIDSQYGGEHVSIIGGQVSGDIQLGGSNTLVDGTTLTGPSAEITVNGYNNTIQNTIINGDIPNYTAARDGAIVINGANNILRFNTIVLGAGTGLREGAIALENPGSNTQIYGNIIHSQFATFYQAFGGLPGINAHDNLFSGSGTPMVIFPYASPMPVTSWPTSVSANELIGDANFTDAPDGDLSLQASSIGAYVYNPATDAYVMYDYYGNTRPTILASLGAVQAPSSGTTGISWAVDSDGTWSTSGNWGGNAVPNSTDIIALLGPIISAPRTVTVSSPETVGLLYFSSAISYTVAGSGTITFNSSSGSSAIDVAAGNHIISAALNLSNPTAVNLASTSVLTINGSVKGTGALTSNGAGTLLVSTNASIGVPLVANGNLTIAAHGNTGGILVQTIPSLTVGARGLATLADPGVANHSNRTLLVTGGLTFASDTSGVFDLTSNDLDVQNGNLSQITAAVATGYSGGAWNSGAGIISSAAAADTTHLTTLGVILNSTSPSGNSPLFGAVGGFGRFDGTSPATSDVLVKYTYYGDANLDGKVDASDYSRIDSGYLAAATGWYNGDFNYDGIIDGSDYTLIDNAFNIQGAALTAQVSPTAQITTEIAATTSVPEPAGAMVIGASLLGTLRRRPRSMTR